MACMVNEFDSVEQELRAREACRLREIVYFLQAGDLPADWDPCLGSAGGYQPGNPVPLYLVTGICIGERINIRRALKRNTSQGLLARRCRQRDTEGRAKPHR